MMDKMMYKIIIRKMNEFDNKEFDHKKQLLEKCQDPILAKILKKDILHDLAKDGEHEETFLKIFYDKSVDNRVKEMGENILKCDIIDEYESILKYYEEAFYYLKLNKPDFGYEYINSLEHQCKNVTWYNAPELYNTVYNTYSQLEIIFSKLKTCELILLKSKPIH